MRTHKQSSSKALHAALEYVYFASMPAEEWPSGLRRTPGKRVGAQAPQGFESPLLRH